MGDFISMGEALIVALFSILLVFVVLIVIAIIINALKAFSVEKKPGKKDEQKMTVSKDETSVGGEDPKIGIEDSSGISEELVAVIAAAVAANLGTSIPEINIKSIRRTSQSVSPWANAGNIKQVNNKL